MDYNFHAKSFKFDFFSDFRVVNRIWIMAPDLWQFLTLTVIADLIYNLLPKKLLPTSHSQKPEAQK